MAYGKKYTIDFKQMKSYDGVDGWTIEIYKDGYSGSVTDLYTEQDSINLSREAGLFNYLCGTKLNFGLYNLTEGQYKEFRDASWGEYYCILKRSNGDVKFVGYNQSEIYTESYDQTPYSAKLEFTCGLNHLKYVRFDNAGTLYSGQKSIIEVLRLCLNKLPYPLSIREYVNIYEDDQNSTTTDSMLNQTYVRTEIYREDEDNQEVGWFCNRIIEEILKPFCSHIYINEGKWNIVRWQEYDQSTMYYREYLPRVGSESTITVDSSGSITTNKRATTTADGTANELVLLAEDTEMSIEPPINRLKLEYKQDSSQIENFDLLKNGDFKIRRVTDAVNYPNGIPQSWTYTNMSQTIYDTNFKINNDVFLRWIDITSNVANDTRYISQTIENIYVGTSDNLRFDIAAGINLNLLQTNTNSNYQNVQNSLASQTNIYIRYQIKVGSYYLNQTGVNYGTWTTTATTNLIILPINWFVNFWGAQTAINETLLRKLVNNTISTDDLPVSGFTDIEVKIFQPYTNIISSAFSGFTLTLNNLGITDLKLTYMPDTNAAINDYVIYQKIDEDVNEENITIIHGDGLYQFSPNSFRLSTGVVTNEWQRRGKTEALTIFEQILIQYKELKGSFVKLLSGKLIGQINPINTIETTVGATTTNYAINTYSYNVESNEWDVELIELSDFTSLTVSQEVATELVPINSYPTQTTPLTQTYSDNNIIGSQTQMNFDSNQTNNYL